MADLHRLPLLGHDPPCPRPRKARVYSFTVGNGRYWSWEHRCSSFGYEAVAGHDTWPVAYWAALHHVKRCRG